MNHRGRNEGCSVDMYHLDIGIHLRHMVLYTYSTRNVIQQAIIRLKYSYCAISSFDCAIIVSLIVLLRELLVSTIIRMVHHYSTIHSVE